MSPSVAMKFAGIMLVVYMAAAGVCMYNDDHDHAFMLLIGSLLWIASIFIWSRTKKDEEPS
jgi:hypothetical protein